MKKLISTILIGAFAVSIFATPVFAQSQKEKSTPTKSFVTATAQKSNWTAFPTVNIFPQQVKKIIPKGIAKKMFDDISNVKWAQKAIEMLKSKGLVKGYDDKTFGPNNKVTKIETIVMALRVMGWENEAKRIKELPKKYKNNQVGQWANGYITLAYEKGILDDVDLLYLNLNEPAKRYEVAQYVVRALGYEEEAEDNMDEDLPFIDADLVPKGAVGYVYIVNDLGLMKGDNQKRFNPMGTLTRAEMAVLFQRLDDKVDSEVDDGEVTGEITQISDDKITVKVDGKEQRYDVDDDVIVYEDDDRIDYSDLDKGDKVILEIEDQEVVCIEIVDEIKKEKIISKYTGTVVDIDTASPKEIIIQIEKMKVTFEPIKSIKVYFKRESGSFDDIEIGDKVSIKVDTLNRAREINVDRELDDDTTETVSGYVYDIDLSGIYHITIEDEEYELSKDADVDIKGRSNEELEDIKPGYYVECELTDDIITSIYAEDKFKEVEGEIEDVNTNSIEVKVNGKIKEFEYANAFEVYIDGKSKSYNDLEEGMEVELKVRGDVVYQIYAET